MNAVHTFPRDPNASVVTSLRNSAAVAERVGHGFRASEYQRLAEAAELHNMPGLYRHFANEAALWAAGQGVQS